MSHLEKHVRTHTEERRHVCNICGAAFILPHHLVRHNMVHTGVRPFECETCHKQFTRKAGLAQHEYVHTGIRPYVCEVPTCGKQFTDRSTLRRHLLTHSREKPFLCKECEKTFRTKSACRKHYLRHFKGLESFKCGICEEMFVSAELLEKHSAIHEEKQKQGSPSYRCGFCLRVFITQNDLDAHVPLHQTGMRHSCNQCTAKFYTEQDLINHMERHENSIMNNMSDNNGSSIYNSSPEQKPYDDNSTMMKADKSMENLNLPNTHQREQLNLPNSAATTANNCSKVVVVLQLPPTATGVMKNNQGNFELSNLQQLLGSAQIDKLLVTTDPVTDSSSTLSLELSQDQQEGIQQILQTTSINSVEYMRPENELNPIPSINQCSLQEHINHLTSNNNVSNAPELTTLQSPYTMKAPTHPDDLQNDKQNSAYIIVPNYDQNGGNDMSFSTGDDYKGMMRNDHMNNIRKLGSESVFLSNKNMLQQMMQSEENKHDIPHDVGHSLGDNGVNSVPAFENHPINNDAVFSIGESITGIDVNSIVRAVRKLPNNCVKCDTNNLKFPTDDLFKMV